MANVSQLFFCLALLAASDSAAVAASSSPPIPAWPEQFSVQLTILVEQYGSKFQAKGALYYDYSTKTFRSDYIDWCLPLFDSGPTDINNYTCSFLATEGSMYFVNHTASNWDDYQCCLFEKGLAAVPPDWMKNCQYNGTQKIGDIEVDAWWFTGTSDPEKPCYGYWDALDAQHTPVKFFGLSSVGPTILQYHQYKPGSVPSDVHLNLPSASCQKECEPPLIKRVKEAGFVGVTKEHAWPTPWPAC